MMRILLIAGALVWGLWWFAGAYGGPVKKDTVSWDITRQGELQKSTTYNNSTVKAYRKAVATPRTTNDWLGRVRRERGGWQWWLLGVGPIVGALVYAARRS